MSGASGGRGAVGSPGEEICPECSPPVQRLAGLLPAIDLTEFARSGRMPPVVAEPFRGLLPTVARSLFRQQPAHLVLTGRPGVGKSTLIHELARQAAIGNIPFLAAWRFLSIDCRNVGPEDSRACLESIFHVVAGERQLVLILDGFASVLRRANGGSNKPLLRAMIQRPGLRLIGTMSASDFNDLISGDAEMRQLFTRLELEEPTDAEALAIARQHGTLFREQFKLRIDDRVIERTVALTSTFLLSECQPAKSLQVLRQVCDDAEYDRTQLQRPRDEISVGDIIRSVSERTGIPPETIAGETSLPDFEAALTDAVVGQERAIKSVANELRLIKSGLNEPGKPAAVLLFAGMTGVGKTELAKRVAELYSASHRLQTYTMANFTEPHSVSGIIGVPPGYVGHDEGGRLINELIADPYSVFLLDEAEKCHPNIWKPFLNLFDEGWIVDQRGVKAHADRAIFILTTNAGDRHVAQMAQSGAPASEIADRVRQALSQVRHERASQPVFPPQFLARIKQIVVFNPLSDDAMVGIAERTCRRMGELWRLKREKILQISPEVTRAIGRIAHARNQKSNGDTGGRAVKRLVTDLIESKIQAAGIERPDQYQASRTICVDLAVDQSPEAGADLNLRIEFDPPADCTTL